VDGGHNISFPDTTCAGANGDPKLGALVGNGGRTETMALGEGSAAIDVVPSSGAGCTATDQRGVIRPQRTACDAGAFELEPLPVQQPGPGGPGGQPGGGGTLLDKIKPVVKWLLRKQRLGKVLKSGYVADYSTNELGNATLDVYVQGKDAKGVAKTIKRRRVARAVATVTKVGKNRVVAKFSKKATKRFAKRKRLNVLLVLTVKDPAGNATKLTRKVRLKR
jgi:hypothetical protein